MHQAMSLSGLTASLWVCNIWRIWPYHRRSLAMALVDTDLCAEGTELSVRGRRERKACVIPTCLMIRLALSCEPETCLILQKKACVAAGAATG